MPKKWTMTLCAAAAGIALLGGAVAVAQGAGTDDAGDQRSEVSALQGTATGSPATGTTTTPATGATTTPAAGGAGTSTRVAGSPTAGASGLPSTGDGGSGVESSLWIFLGGAAALMFAAGLAVRTASRR
jgi:hypothetical protein